MKRKTTATDIPSRPLSAYNFFFKEQRVKIIEEVNAEMDRDPEASAFRADVSQPVSFKEMARLVGKRWQNVTADEVRFYKDLAQKDLERYRREMTEYKKTNPDLDSRKSSKLTPGHQLVLPVVPVAPTSSIGESNVRSDGSPGPRDLFLQQEEEPSTEEDCITSSLTGLLGIQQVNLDKKRNQHFMNKEARPIDVTTDASFDPEHSPVSVVSAASLTSGLLSSSSLFTACIENFVREGRLKRATPGTSHRHQLMMKQRDYPRLARIMPPQEQLTNVNQQAPSIPNPSAKMSHLLPRSFHQSNDLLLRNATETLRLQETCQPSFPATRRLQVVDSTGSVQRGRGLLVLSQSVPSPLEEATAARVNTILRLRQERSLLEAAILMRALAPSAENSAVYSVAGANVLPLTRHMHH